MPSFTAHVGVWDAWDYEWPPVIFADDVIIIITNPMKRIEPRPSKRLLTVVSQRYLLRVFVILSASCVCASIFQIFTLTSVLDY